MDEKYKAPAVEKMLLMIEALARKGDGCSINELSRDIGSSTNSVYRICVEMEKKNYLTKDTVTGKYKLGSAFYFIGKAAEKNIGLKTYSSVYLNKLKTLTGETAHLAILRDKTMVLFDQVETDNSIKFQVDTGSALYPHASAFGKCMLAFSSEEFLRDYTDNFLASLTQNTITDRARLLRELELIRESKTAYDNEEYMKGIVCVGSPVFDFNGVCVAAIGVVVPEYRMKKENYKLFSEYVLETAQQYTRSLGGGKN